MKSAMPAQSKSKHVPLGELVLDASNGLASGKRQDDGTCQIRMNNVDTEGNLSLTSLIRIPATDAEVARYSLRAGDVLFNNTNSRELVGKSALFCGYQEPVLFSNHFTRLRVDPTRLDPGYLARWLSAMQRQRVFERLANQWVNQSAVRKDSLLGLSIPLPTLSEQSRIATVLDKAYAIRHKRRQTLETANDLVPAIFFDMFGDPASNDRGWPVVCVDEAGDVQLGRQRAPKYQTGKYTRRYLRVANVFEDRIDLDDVLSMDFDEHDFNRYRLEDGDILLNEGQSTELVGRPAIWRSELPECCFQNTLVRFKAYRNRCSPEYAQQVFLAYLHKSQFARISSKTSSVAHLSAARFARMPFPLPPLPLQLRFEARSLAVRSTLTKYQEASARANDLFGSLVQRAFAGQL